MTNELFPDVVGTLKLQWSFSQKVTVNVVETRARIIGRFSFPVKLDRANNVSLTNKFFVRLN